MSKLSTDVETQTARASETTDRVDHPAVGQRVSLQGSEPVPSSFVGRGATIVDIRKENPRYLVEVDPPTPRSVRGESGDRSSGTRT